MKKTALIFAMVVCMVSLYPSDYFAYATEFLPGVQAGTCPAIMSCQKNTSCQAFYKTRSEAKSVKRESHRATVSTLAPVYSLNFAPIAFLSLGLYSTENTNSIPTPIFHIRE